MTKEVEGLENPDTSGANILKGEITNGTVIDPPPTTDGLNITSDDAKRKMGDLRSSYGGLLHQMMPLVDIEATLQATSKTRNSAVAARLANRETAKLLIQKITVEMSRAKDEISEMADVFGGLEDGLTSAFMSALDVTKNFEDCIHEMARNVIRHLYRLLVV